MIRRIRALAVALLFASGAFLHVQFSGATWTASTSTPFAVAAQADWAPPTVVVADLPVGVQGTAVNVSATASDDRSPIDPASVRLEYAAAGSSTWTVMTGCTSSGSNPLTHSCVWDTSLLSDGDYQVRAFATDTAGYSTTSAVEPTSIVNNPGVVLDPFPAGLSSTVQLTTSLFNSGNSTAQFNLEYTRDGGVTWTLICTNKKITTLTCAWDVSALPEGSYVVRVRADANNGHFTDSQAVVVDHALPSASLTVPAGLLSGTVDLTATAADVPSGVASVDFGYRLVGAASWSSCGVDSTSPYACSLSTVGLTNGASYEFRATASDLAGNTFTTPAQARTVDNTPAVVSITSPPQGATIDGTVQVTADAQSVRGVTAVRIDYRSGAGGFTPLCSDTTSPYSCSWDVSTLGAGAYELRAVLSQTAGGDVASTSRSVTVDHSAGTVSITSPATGTTASHQNTVAVSGTTSAPSGVSAVTLRATPRPSGTTTSTACTLGAGTFTCAWDTSGIVYGTYDLQAEMVQGNGVVVTALTAVSVTVDNVVGSVSLNLNPAAPTGFVQGAETLTATTSSNLGVASVRYDVSPVGANTWSAVCTPAATTSPYSCSWGTGALANASYDLRAVMTLSNGATVTSSTTTVAVVNLWAADVDAGNQDGSLTSADTLTLTYSTRVDLASIRSGWTGASTPVALAFRDALDAGAGTGKDRLDFTDANLGQVAFAQDYVKKNNGFTANGTMTAAVVNGRTVITVTLVNPPNGSTSTSTATGAMVWTPSTAATEYNLGGACAAAAVTESGAADKDL